MSEVKVTVFKCDKCGAEGEREVAWTTVTTPIPRQKGSNRRRRSKHLCPPCTDGFNHWLTEGQTAPDDPNDAIELAEWLASGPK